MNSSKDRAEGQAFLLSTISDGRSGRRAEARCVATIDRGADGSTVSCAYCREPILADTFTFWSSARRLVSADCPHCGRRVTLTAATWHRSSRLPTSLLDQEPVFPWLPVKQVI